MDSFFCPVDESPYDIFKAERSVTAARPSMPNLRNQGHKRPFKEEMSDAQLWGKSERWSEDPPSSRPVAPNLRKFTLQHA